MLQIHNILLWIRIRGSMPLTNGSGCGSGFGSGCGSCYFIIDLQDANKKLIFKIAYAYYFLKVHLHNFSKIKSQKEVTKQQKSRFFLFLCLMIEGTGSGSITLTSGSGSGSRRPKKCGSGGSDPDSDPQPWFAVPLRTQSSSQPKNVIRTMPQDFWFRFLSPLNSFNLTPDTWWISSSSKKFKVQSYRRFFFSVTVVVENDRKSTLDWQI